MRSTLSSIAVLAATLQFASAGFSDANKFSCPSNTNNQCNGQQSTGFDWSSLNLGSFSNYGDFNFNGWSCDSSFGGKSRRDALTGRGFQDKVITGTCHHDAPSCPSFGCDSSPSVKQFSVVEFYVSVEFDCELEFHYSMPGGQTCKQKSHCSSGGSIIKNSQCGGAKNVTIVYPPQSTGPGKAKPTCSIGVHSMSFDCSSASSTVYHSTTTRATVTKSTSVSTKPASSSATTTSVVKSSSISSVTKSVETSTSSLVIKSTSSSAVGTTSSSVVSSVVSSQTTTSVSSPSVSSPPVSSPATTDFTTSTVFTTFVSTIISCAESVTNCPARSTVLTTVSVAISTTICPVTSTSAVTSPGLLSSPAVSSPVVSTSSAIGTLSSISSIATTSIAVTSSPISSPVSSPVSSVISTSPVQSEVITTVVVETSTTICPVTLTQVHGGTTSLETSTTIHTASGTTSTETSTISHISGGTTTFQTTVSTSTVEITTTKTVCNKCDKTSTAPGVVSTPQATSNTAVTATTSSSGPATTAPCPDVLPSCLNTWLFLEGCLSNTDSDCYCPSSTFVSNVFGCLSAYGANDDEISQAQTYFQGICAAHIPSNPAIVTAASSQLTTTQIVTVTTPVTTIQVLTTLVVPCSETTGPNSGAIIPASSTTVVISTAVIVPQVAFSTVPGLSTPSAALVIGTAPATVEAGATTLAIPASSTFAVVPTAAGNGTGRATPTPTQLTASGALRNTFTFGSVFAGLLVVLAL